MRIPPPFAFFYQIKLRNTRKEHALEDRRSTYAIARKHMDCKTRTANMDMAVMAKSREHFPGPEFEVRERCIPQIGQRLCGGI
jgi:hypothetical protein